MNINYVNHPLHFDVRVRTASTSYTDLGVSTGPRVISSLAHVYPATRYVVLTSMHRAGAAGYF
jgi:hypothetical protein